VKEKATAGLVTALLVAPICALCLLVPVMLGGGLTWLSAWLGGFDWGTAGALAGLAAILVFAIVRRRRTRDGRRVS
jgi:hypothetical protein